MDKTHVSGVMGLIVIAFGIFAVGSLFDPGEYIMLISAITLAGVLFAVFWHSYVKRRSNKDELNLFDTEKRRNEMRG